MSIVITTTIKIDSQIAKLVPVKTSEPVLQKDIEEIMAEISKISVKPPVRKGDAVVKDICKKGIDLLATKNMMR